MKESEVHTISNALTVVMGNLELLKDETEIDLELIENALKGSERILKLVEEQNEIHI